MIIGLEGVSCTGKSALARGLADGLEDVRVVPCYYHCAPDPSVMPSPKVTTEADQIEALVFLLGIEELRMSAAREQLARGGLVLLDRTVDTLLAHMYAVDAMNGLDASARARALVSNAIAQGLAAVPDVTLLLRADPRLLAARALARPDLPLLYYDPEFTAGFNDYFADPITPVCLNVDAGLAPGEVLAASRQLLRPFVAGQL